jgi:hypothetical protein
MHQTSNTFLVASRTDSELFPYLSPEEQARLHDISFPLQVRPLRLLATEQQIVLSYRTELSQVELIAFYHPDMEYCGWEEIAVVQAAESALLYSKPSKLCSIYLRPEGAYTHVTLFVATKMSPTS